MLARTLLSGKLNPPTVRVPLEVPVVVVLPQAVATTTNAARIATNHRDEMFRIIESLLGAGRLLESNPDCDLNLPLCGLEGGASRHDRSPQKTYSTWHQHPFQPSEGELGGHGQHRDQEGAREEFREVLLGEAVDDVPPEPSTGDQGCQGRGRHHLDS